MKRFTEAGRRAVADENWYAALTTALIIPDICGSIEQPGSGKSRKRYEDWCRIWLQPKFSAKVGPRREVLVLLSAEDIYQARCSIIHSGTADIEEKRRDKIDRFEFFSHGNHMNMVRPSVNGVPQPRYLQLRVDMFCETVFTAADAWDATVAADPIIQAEKAKLLVIHSPGAIIGGIQWR